jgi:hypothetical protein
MRTRTVKHVIEYNRPIEKKSSQLSSFSPS